MVKLDINTPRGQLTLEDERAAVAIFHRHYPHLRYIHTPKHDMGDIDAMVINPKLDALACIVETRCRYDMTLEKFDSAYDRKWLMTFDKFVKGFKLAEACRVAFYGFLYIVPSKALLIKRLWAPELGLDVGLLQIRKTDTQATVNGGRAMRDNAFIDMAGVEPLFMTEVFHQ